MIGHPKMSSIIFSTEVTILHVLSDLWPIHLINAWLLLGICLISSLFPASCLCQVTNSLPLPFGLYYWLLIFAACLVLYHLLLVPYALPYSPGFFHSYPWSPTRQYTLLNSVMTVMCAFSKLLFGSYHCHWINADFALGFILVNWANLYFSCIFSWQYWHMILLYFLI